MGNILAKNHSNALHVGACPLSMYKRVLPVSDGVIIVRVFPIEQ